MPPLRRSRGVLELPDRHKTSLQSVRELSRYSTERQLVRISKVVIEL